jgi:hypothetical protein
MDGPDWDIQVTWSTLVCPWTPVRCELESRNVQSGIPTDRSMSRAHFGGLRRPELFQHQRFQTGRTWALCFLRSTIARKSPCSGFFLWLVLCQSLSSLHFRCEVICSRSAQQRPACLISWPRCRRWFDQFPQRRWHQVDLRPGHEKGRVIHRRTDPG